MDVCEQPPVPGVPGAPSGITGLRRFDNPDFNPAGWNAETYLKNPGKTQPPYLIGMTCGFCHIGFNPLNPPDNPELPRWANLAGAIGNQFWEEGRLFNLRMPATDFRWHVGNRQPAGTSDTSRFATDHINNPNAINSIFNLEFRPTHIEQMADGTMMPVHHILKEGADSIGIAGASLRVYVNIGMCSDYWITLHDPVMGRTRQKPFDIAYARANCADWRATEARMANAEAFLKTLRPMHLRDAPGGAAMITADAATLQRGKIAFADKCARVPLEQAAAGRRRGRPRPGGPRGIANRCSPTISSSAISCPTIAAIPSRCWARTSPAPWRPTPRPRASGRSSRQSPTRTRSPSGASRICTTREILTKPIDFDLGGGGRGLLPHADAHLDVGDRSLSAQQHARHSTSRTRRCADGCSRSRMPVKSCCGPSGGSACSRWP